MATYKAEFLSHYYAGRLRPRQAYALGLIRWEAQLGARAPRVANMLTHREPFATLGKRLAGVAPERSVPAFAPMTFTRWFRERHTGSPGHAGYPSAVGPGPRRVVLFPDTFNDHFHPEVAIAATEVLEAAGFQVVVPQRSSAAGDRSTTTACSAWRSDSWYERSMGCATRYERERRWWRSSPAAARCSATS